MKTQALFLILVLTVATVSAQAWSDKFQVGIKGGVNFATVTGDDFDNPDGRTNFYAGLLAEAPLTERFSLQPEVFYSGQGFNLSDGSDGLEGDFHIDYIQVPVIFKVYLLDGLNIHAGPQFGFKVNEEVDLSSSDGGVSFDTDNVKDFDFQVTGGVEYKFAERFFAQARYTYGFSDIVEDIDSHNSVLSAGIGFMF